MNFEKYIKNVPDFPKKGIDFKDISPLLLDPQAFQASVDALAKPFEKGEIDLICGVEARGFIFSPSIAVKLGAGFMPVRKAGKLPGEVVMESYNLEYGDDRLEIQKGLIKKGAKVLIVDDVLATGGTVEATQKLVEKEGAEVVGFSFLIELGFLSGREKIDHQNIFSLINFT